MVLGGIVEYLFSFFQEKFFGTVSWDYSNLWFNINGRTSLLHCLYWGTGGVLFVKYIYPFIEKLINKECNKNGIYNISDIKKPLVIPSVNMNTGEVICFTSCLRRGEYSDKIKFVNDAPIGKVVRASCSYPVVFSPCEYKDMELLDGGIRENVPWKELELLGAKNIVNVIFESDKNDNCCENLIEVAGRSIDLLCRELSNYEMQGSYKILKIKTEKTGLLDSSKLENLYYLGYKQAKEFLN